MNAANLSEKLRGDAAIGVVKVVGNVHIYDGVGAVATQNLTPVP